MTDYDLIARGAGFGLTGRRDAGSDVLGHDRGFVRREQTGGPAPLAAAAMVLFPEDDDEDLMGLELVSKVFGLAPDRWHVEAESDVGAADRSLVFDRFIREAQQRKYDALMISKLSRLGPDMLSALATLAKLRDRGIAVYAGGLGRVMPRDLFALPLRS